MEYELDNIMGIDKLDLYYEAHCAGLDGECFDYSVYFDSELTDEKFEKTNSAINEFISSFNDKDMYIGYIDVSKKEDKVYIYLDLGNAEPDNGDVAIHGILKALNNVPGIKSVIMNQECDYSF